MSNENEPVLPPPPAGYVPLQPWNHDGKSLLDIVNRPTDQRELVDIEVANMLAQMKETPSLSKVAEIMMTYPNGYARRVVLMVMLHRLNHEVKQNEGE